MYHKGGTRLMYQEGKSKNHATCLPLIWDRLSPYILYLVSARDASDPASKCKVCICETRLIYDNLTPFFAVHLRNATDL